MKLARPVFALLLVALMAGLVQAQPGGGGRGQRGGGFGGGRDPVAQFERLMTAAGKLEGLTADQTTSLDGIKTEWTPKFKALKEKGDGILTADQKKIRDEAMAAMTAATSREDRTAAMAKLQDMKLTDDQKKAQTDLRTEVTTTMTEARAKVNAVLTDDQKAKLKTAMQGGFGGRGGKGGKGGKGGNAPAPAKETT